MKKNWLLRKLMGVILFGIMGWPIYAIQLELTQGIDKPILIMIPNFQTVSNTQDPLAIIVRNDLNRSGRFHAEVFDAQADNQVFGSVKAIDAHHDAVEFSLNSKIQQRTLLKKQFVIASSQMRSLAHHLSDLIYQQLLGVKGYFSTQLAYILINRNEYGTRYALMLSDVDGYNARALLTSTQPIVSPAWSPDGRKIAYVSFEKVTPSIYVQDVQTGKRQLISHYEGINGAPAWSPDCRYLAMALSKQETNPKIYVLDLQSKNLRQLTFGQGIDTEPSWSPDGKSLLFTSDRSGSPQIYQVTLDDHKIIRLSLNGDYNARGRFSPDGQAIAMLTRNEGYHIALQDLSTQRLTVLTDTPDKSPSFSPDGYLVLYECNQAQHRILRMISIDGRIHAQIPTPPGEIQDPVWSPFLS